ncbi:MAG: chorismate synthase, partial [Clostridia bacterium]|nr:chorismate synthase [Clostridia bacterium]
AVESEIASLAFAVPAVKGIQFGEGFSFSELSGSVANDPFRVKDGKIITKTNRNGGINGGITNGMPIYFSVVIKPTPSIFKEQDSVDITTMQNVKLKIKGRHDACIAVRAVPVVEGITALSLLDKMS